MVRYLAKTAITGLDISVWIKILFIFPFSPRLLCPDVQRNHPLLADSWRKQVFLTQEVQREVDEDAPDGAQLFGGLLRVALDQSRSADVFL